MLAAVSEVIIVTQHKHVPSAVSSAEAQQPKVLYHPLAARDAQSDQPIRVHGLFFSLFLEKQHPHFSAPICHMARSVQDTTVKPFQ